jgi:phage shock protein PspC (stress-responsive transcriptional regulator)
MQMNRRLYRCRENRVLAGVAAGVAEFFDLDPTLVRILWFLSVFVGGVGILLYVGLAIIVPLEPVEYPQAPAMSGESPDAAGAPGAGAPSATPPIAAHNHAAGPSEGHGHGRGGTGRVSMFLGFGLILFGSLALLDIALPELGLSWRQLWPVLIIGIGGLLIVGALRREREPTEL